MNAYQKFLTDKSNRMIEYLKQYGYSDLATLQSLTYDGLLGTPLNLSLAREVSNYALSSGLIKKDGTFADDSGRVWWKYTLA